MKAQGDPTCPTIVVEREMADEAKFPGELVAVGS